MKPSISTQEHYDRLAESGHGRDDPPFMQEYMAQWDGPPFFAALGDPSGKNILEVGIGGGRIARELLTRDCHTLTGLDVSPKTIAAARSDLSDFPNLELIHADICEFCRPTSFDMAYSVLTFMHVQDKQKALRNVVDSLRSGGHVVLSINHTFDLLDFGDWTVPLHPWSPERYVEVLSGIGCKIDETTPLIDKWVQPNGRKSDTFGETIATLVKATKSKGLSNEAMDGD